MSASINAPEDVTPEAVLNAHMRALVRDFRAKLAEAYEEPHTAFDRFRDNARDRGPTEAAITMRDDPARFGALREGGEPAAREAAVLGGRAYQARVGQSDPRLGAQALDQAVTRAIEEAGHDPVRFRRTWNDLGRAYGPDTAAGIVVRRAPDVFGPTPAPGLAVHVARLSAAADHLRVRAGIWPAATIESSPPLPRSISEEADAASVLPGHLQARLVAAADGMRRRLAAAYMDPLGAEARLHARVDEQGLEALTTADRHLFGDLRTDLPGGAERAEEAAQAAIGYARTAYEYHLARGPGAADTIAARDQLRAARLAGRDPQRAIDGIHEAVQLHGPELAAHLGRHRGPGHSRDPERGPGGPGASPHDGSRVAPAATTTPPRGAGRDADTAIDEAVRAHERVEEARRLSEQGRRLREERAGAERIIAKLNEQDAVRARALRDLKAAAGTVYRDPDAAVKNWEKLVLREGGHLERARDQVAERPEILGRLRSEASPGLAGRLGWTSNRPAREAAPRVADYAVTYTQAQRAAGDPVRWTTPEGTTIHGRAQVREAAGEVLGLRQREIAAADGRLTEIGGVRESERAAHRAVRRLSPDQSGQAATRIAAHTGASVATVLTTLARLGVEGTRVGRALGEGPAGM